MYRKIYDICKEPVDAVYTQLVGKSFSFCKEFILVVRSYDELGKNGLKVLSDLEPFFVEKRESLEWPGTVLLNGTAFVYKYTYNIKSAEILTTETTHLYDWVHPFLPEDLCLLRSDNSPWLVNIAHERDSYLCLTNDEKAQLSKAIPSLCLRKSSQNSVEE